MILGLDIATNTGYAVGGLGKPITFGSRNFSAYSGRRALLGYKFALWLHGLIQEHDIRFLAIEAPLYKNGGAARLLIPLAYEAEKAGLRNQLPFAEYSPKTIKKFMTGDGHAKKKDMIFAVGQLGFKVQNDDQADAISVLKLHESILESRND